MPPEEVRVGRKRSQVELEHLVEAVVEQLVLLELEAQHQ